MARDPDFIIIGAMKCATSTLHEQLAQQAGIFMTQPKEPSFFSDDAQYARGIDWYRRLFQGAHPEDLCGESSTHYTKLPTYPRTLARMREHVPNAKLVYVMRHPIERLVSHYIHEWTQRVIDAPIDRAIDEHPELVDYSRYAMQLEPFLATYGSQRVLPVFTERLRARPQSELERVSRFIGYGRTPQWHEVAPVNTSADRMRRSALREAARAVPGVRSVYRALVPGSMRRRIDGLWRMRQRPELSPGRWKQLAGVFDQDLATLGRWLGVELRCETFNEVVITTPLEWSEHAARIPV